MRQEEYGHSGPLEPFEEVDKIVPFKPEVTSERLEWAGLGAARFRAVPDCGLRVPIITYHQLFLFRRPPEKLSLVYEGVHRHVPPPAGAISLMPTGSPTLWQWSGRADTLLIFLDPKLVARVAAEKFDLDPARLTVPLLDAVDLPELRTAMQAVDAELNVGDDGGPLVAELLANILAVQLIQHIWAPRRRAPKQDGPLAQKKLRTVIEYIEAHLNASPTLEQMAAIVRLSPFHFARQFKQATGLPPHQYVISRRVERARELLQGGGNPSLVQVASHTGFVDPSQLIRHFKRHVGVTPGQFRQG